MLLPAVDGKQQIRNQPTKDLDHEAIFASGYRLFDNANLAPSPIICPRPTGSMRSGRLSGSPLGSARSVRLRGGSEDDPCQKGIHRARLSFLHGNHLLEKGGHQLRNTGSNVIFRATFLHGQGPDHRQRLVSLMGHASKHMVFKIYGNYVEGLEEDTELIFEYFGADFLQPRKRKNPVPFGYSTGHSCEVSAVTY